MTDESNEKVGVGRPTKYKDEFCGQVRKLCERGFINIEIAEFFEVNIDTIYEWMKKHPEFSEAMELGKQKIDREVEQSLLSRAMGFEYEENKAEYENGNETKRTVTKKTALADVSACKHWLANRQPKRWRDTITVEHELSDDFNDLLDDAADEDK